MIEVKNKGQKNLITIVSQSKTQGNLEVDGNFNDVYINTSENSNINIKIMGDRNVVYIDCERIGKLRSLVSNGASIIIRKGTTIEEAYFLADQYPIDIGSDCMISFQVQIRTTDAHGIYSLSDKKLTNPPGPVMIGRHVWIAQGVLINKNSAIGNNAILGARSFLQNIVVPDSTLVVGTPARVIRQDVTWRRDMKPTLE